MKMRVRVVEQDEAKRLQSGHCGWDEVGMAALMGTIIGVVRDGSSYRQTSGGRSYIWAPTMLTSMDDKEEKEYIQLLEEL